MNPVRDLPGYLRLFQSYVGRRMYYILGLTLIAVLFEGFGLMMLLPLLETLDASGNPDTAASQLVNSFLEGIGLDGSVVAILMILGFAFLLKGLAKFAQAAYTGYLQAQLMRELKARMFDAYSHMDYRYYVQRDTGYFVNVINQQITRFYQSFTAFIGLLAGIVTSLGYLGIAFFVSWQFGAMAVGMAILIFFAFIRLNSYVRRLSRAMANEASHLNKLLIQTLQAFKYVTATDEVGHLRTGVNKSIRRLTGYQMRQQFANAFTNSVTEPISIVVIIGIVIVQLTVLAQPLGPMVVAIILFHRALRTIMGIQGQWQRALGAVGSVEMVRDEFNNQRQNREPNGTRAIGPLTHRIELDRVHFAYNPELGNVLEDISLTIPHQSTAAFVGESGAGKSTLVDILALLLRPQSGQVLIDGVPGEVIERSAWRSQIGYVSQETVVFDDTIANNICLWDGDYHRDPALRDRIVDAAERAHIRSMIEGLPQGYDTLVGDRGVRLSGGQRQRLFIARELYKRPNLLILDEATSSLDSDSERHIQASIDALKGTMTVVIIAHRLATIRNADHVFVLDRGRLIEQGPYSELRDTEDSRFGQMVATQSL